MFQASIFLHIKKVSFEKTDQPACLREKTRIGYFIKTGLTVFTGLVFFTLQTFCQTENLSYNVIQNNNTIGWIKIHKVETGAVKRITLDSEIKKRFVFAINVIEKQEASFNNGLLTESFIYRKVNDDVKLNKRTLFTGKFYEVKNSNSSQRLTINRIQYNLLCLYFWEPVNIKQVYSDSFQQFLDIEHAENGCYKIQLPDGNINYYYYVNGICSRVKIDHSLFTIEFVRN